MTGVMMMNVFILFLASIGFPINVREGGGRRRNREAIS